MPRIVKTSFNAGEVSERLYGRIDLQQYGNACKTLQDMIPLPHGGCTRRPGFEFINEVKTSSEISGLIPFQFSTIQAYMIEAGDEYMRFYKNGAQIQSVDSSTKLLLHFDGVNGSSTFVDDGYTKHTITTNGTVQHTTSTKKFGPSSGLFWGTDDYLSIQNHADWDIVDQTNFTVDFWIKFSAHSGTDGIISQYEDSSNFWTINHTGGTGFIFRVYSGGSNIVITTGGEVTDTTTWHHIAVIKVGNEYGIYKDGQQVSYDGDSSTDTFTGPINIGSLDGTNWDFEGTIDEMRVYHGNAFGAAPNSSLSDTIIPPSVQYPYLGGAGGGGVYELATLFGQDEIELLRWVQSADTLYITSPNRCPQKLTRTDHDSWDIDNIGGLGWTGSGFDADHWPPFLDQNVTATTITPSSTTGSITLTASASLFNSDMVGGWFALHNGYAKVTGFTSDTVVDATVIVTLDAATGTADWFESAWSDHQGWPTCVTFYEDRLCFGGAANNPDRIDMSTTAGYENFYRAELDGGTAAADDAIAIYLASRQINAIKWLAGTRKLLAGTSGGEWWIDGGSADEALDATGTVRRHLDSEHGSANVAPVLIGNTVMFAQRLARAMREFYFDWQFDQYGANDISILSEHLTSRATIAQIAWQQYPHNLLWVRRSDGALVALTYQREHEVVGWSPHQIAGTDAKTTSIAALEGDGEDELWAINERTIDGSTVKYVERMKPQVVIDTGSADDTDWDLEDAFFVDSGLTYRGTPVAAVSGLDHLEGETVVSLADGVVETGLTVSSGSVTLSRPASVIHVGLNYYSDMETLWPIHQDNEGLLLGSPQRILNVSLMLYRTSGGLIGPDSTDMDDIVYPTGYGVGADERVTRGGDRRITRGGDTRIVRGTVTEYDYYTGLTEDMSFGGPDDYYPTVYVRQDEPLPMTLTAVIMDIE